MDTGCDDHVPTGVFQYWSWRRTSINWIQQLGQRRTMSSCRCYCAPAALFSMASCSDSFRPNYWAWSTSGRRIFDLDIFWYCSISLDWLYSTILSYLCHVRLSVRLVCLRSQERRDGHTFSTSCGARKFKINRGHNCVQSAINDFWHNLLMTISLVQCSDWPGIICVSGASLAEPLPRAAECTWWPHGCGCLCLGRCHGADSGAALDHGSTQPVCHTQGMSCL